jgi:Protein of unknown function (DUF2889)
MSTIHSRPIHTRQYRVDVFARDDGLWDLVVHMQDTKYQTVQLEGGPLPAGQPMHDMTLSVRVDAALNILAAQAHTAAAPYAQDCSNFSEVYQKLVGLNLMNGFRAAVRERLGGTQGCTHVTEMTQLLPTAAFQAFGNDMLSADQNLAGQLPKPIDRCRALRREGPVVARLYPRWSLVSNKNKEQNA